MSVSVIVPVLDGARYLDEVLGAVREQGPAVDLIVVDSGSTDGSQAIALAAGATLIEVAKRDFSHGPTRNLAAERASGELLVFLTQDATPQPGWLAAYERAFAADPELGAAFGPHLPRPDTSVMIARELTEFFAGIGDHIFLSNVNAAYRRTCWEQVRFADVGYAEDQAFARALEDTNWRRAYVPDAAVLHAHDYSPLGFARRYFDEYRGLYETSGHVERIGVRSTVRDVRGLVRADRRWMGEQGWTRRRVAAATGRSVTHHTSRKLASALGSQAHRLPEGVQRTLSLEGRGGAGAVEPRTAVPRAAEPRFPYADLLAVTRAGSVPLLAPVPGQADAERLHVAVVIPPFRRGSGGHSTIYNVLSRLEERGHIVSTWLYDPRGYHASEWPAVIRGNLREFFRPIDGPVFKGFDDWHGADVVLATGWDTVYPALQLPDTRARAYFVQDHEPEFFATSAEGLFAERSYAEGLFPICASPWLRDLVETRYGASGTFFQLGVDHAVYRPLREVARRRDTVVFYARDVTARRAVPLGLLALAELHRRRPETRFVLFGADVPVKAPFAYDDLGVASPEELARAYAEATVGLSLSLTNYSLIPQEMLACGLPCVELAGRSLERSFSADAIELAPADPLALALALERLLDDESLWQRRAAAGVELVAGRTWDNAADEVEAGLRAALRARVA